MIAANRTVWVTNKLECKSLIVISANSSILNIVAVGMNERIQPCNLFFIVLLYERITMASEQHRRHLLNHPLGNEIA